MVFAIQIWVETSGNRGFCHQKWGKTSGNHGFLPFNMGGFRFFCLPASPSNEWYTWKTSTWTPWELWPWEFMDSNNNNRNENKLWLIRNTDHFWLVVWIPLKNISQLGWLFPIYGKIKKCSKPPTSILTALDLFRCETKAGGEASLDLRPKSPNRTKFPALWWAENEDPNASD